MSSKKSNAHYQFVATSFTPQKLLKCLEMVAESDPHEPPGVDQPLFPQPLPSFSFILRDRIVRTDAAELRDKITSLREFVCDPNCPSMPTNYAPDSGSGTVAKIKAYHAKYFSYFIVAKLVKLDGFQLACYVGEPALRCYLRELIGYVWADERLSEDEVRLQDQLDNPNYEVAEKLLKKHRALIRQITEVVLTIIRSGPQLPFRLDPAFEYQQQQMLPEFRDYCAHLDGLIHPPDESE